MSAEPIAIACHQGGTYKGPRAVRTAPTSAAIFCVLAMLLVPCGTARAQEISDDLQNVSTDTESAPHYDDGFVLVPSVDNESVPFRLKLKSVQQFKYTNSLFVNHTYTDHLGVERDVIRRHDIQLTRSVFYFSGFAFSPKL